MPYGVVKERKAELAVVEIERQDMCGNCHACEIISGKKKCTLTCKVQEECQAGDRVEIMLGTSHFLQAAYMIYGIPLLGFIIGLCISFLIGKSLDLEQMDWLLAAGMLTGSLAGMIYIKICDRKRNYDKYLPHITKKVEK